MTAWPVDFVEIDCADGRRVEGLRYEPSGPVRWQMLLLHGKGGNCYSGVCRFLPRVLTRAGVRTLALNMRCHDLGYTRYDVPFVDIENGAAIVDGGMWERPADGVLDVRAGIDVLAESGAAPVVVAGHSSGAFYTVTGSVGDERVAGRVLMSPLMSNRRPLDRWFGSRDARAAAVADAAGRVAYGRGHELIPVRTWYYAISCASLVARAEEDERVWLRALGAGRTPVLMIWGSAESRAAAWQACYDTMPEPKRSCVLSGSEHNYIGFEAELAQSIEHFLKYLT